MKNTLKIVFILSIFVYGIIFTYTSAEDIVNENPSPEVIPDTNPVEEPTPIPNPSVNFVIRINDNVLWQGAFTLLNEGSTSISDSTGASYSVNTRSVLATLKALDEAENSFSISNLTYYPAFSSFYLKCILPINEAEACDNWQYAIGSSSPWQSIDQLILNGGETVGIYFGNPHKVELSPTTSYIGEEVSARSLKYDYTDNSWIPLTNVSIGLLLPNPENSWSPIVLSTHQVDSSGIAKITPTEIKDYMLGITEDYYFPTFNLSVIEKTSTGNGGSSTQRNTEIDSEVVNKQFDLDKAFDFLKSLQETDGSFLNSSLYTDWAGFAFGAYSAKEIEKEKLIDFLKKDNNVKSNLTDNERRSIALLALGLNPYDFFGINYIKPIIDSFDGEQFGEKEFINDDIFALIVLSNTGYSFEDKIINDNIKYLISKQREDGSFEESVDMTAAFVSLSSSINEGEDLLNSYKKAIEYLKTKQEKDGGFGNVYSTSWVMSAMQTKGEIWSKNDKRPQDYFASLQKENGSVTEEADKEENKIWSIAHAIISMSLKSWDAILVNVPKTEEVTIKKEVEPTITSIPKEVFKVPTNSSTIKQEVVAGNDITNTESADAEDNDLLLTANVIEGNNFNYNSSYKVLFIASFSYLIGFFIYKTIIKKNLK